MQGKCLVMVRMDCELRDSVVTEKSTNLQYGEQTDFNCFLKIGWTSSHCCHMHQISRGGTSCGTMQDYRNGGLHFQYFQYLSNSVSLQYFCSSIYAIFCSSGPFKVLHLEAVN